MLEVLLTAGIAAVTGMTVLTQRLHTRNSELERRIDKVELRVASEYVTKAELGDVMDRMEQHMVRIEEKLDRIALQCRT